MGKTLIITEKPSVAREYAQILGVRGNQDGYIENDRYVITWCVGHLVTMCYPEEYNPELKKWELDTLPFLPEHYRYTVNGSVRKQYQTVSAQLVRDDISTILWAGDSGREGQVIEENIRMMVNIPSRIVEKRVWIDSTTEEEILRGMREAKPMSDYDNLAAAGVMRAIEDYAVGINFSRILSIKYSNILNHATGMTKYKPIAVGRVMSCVLGMIVNREREIRNFKETVFYRPVAQAGDYPMIKADWEAKEERLDYYKRIGFLDKRKAEAFVASLDKRYAIVSSIESKNEIKYAPLLFNLAELQAECSRLFKLSPDETLTVAQSLYEKKLTTYPRTDARVLTTAVSKEVKKNVQGLMRVEEIAVFVNTALGSRTLENLSQTRYVDDSKVTDHYAIIPTGETGGLGSLSQTEYEVYLLICQRFLAIFQPPAQYRKVKLMLDIGGEKFNSSKRVLLAPGYLSLYGQKLDEEAMQEVKQFDSLRKGIMLQPCMVSLTEGRTQPPKRYTSGSIILAMENAGQLIEEPELREQIKGAGIGTSATRAEIIKKLCDNRHIKADKRQVLTPTDFGEMIYEVLIRSIPALLNPKMTASWEKGLEQIAGGEITQNIYREKFEKFVKTTVEKLKVTDLQSDIITAIKPFTNMNLTADGAPAPLDIICPKCKKNAMRITKSGYGCSGYRKDDDNACDFFVGKIKGKLISTTQLKKLVTDGVTDEISGFQGDKGKFKGRLMIYDDFSVRFKSDNTSETTSYRCPNCGNPLEKKKYKLVCNCGFSMSHTVASKVLDDRDIKLLLAGETTGLIKGFKGSKGAFSTRLKRNGNDIEFVWEEKNSFGDGFGFGL